MANDHLAVIEGWYAPPHLKVDDLDLERFFVDDRYVKSAKRLNVEDLFITDEKRMLGGWFTAVDVRQVIDLSDNSLIPFYVEESNVENLAALISGDNNAE